MRFMSTLLSSISVFILVFGMSNVSLAKTKKYQRPSSATKETAAEPAASPAPSNSGATVSSETPSAGTANATGEKKVDLTDLENRYWTAKDTEFNVVQNRLYTKANKVSFTAFAGPLLSDPYTSSWNFGGAINYYFSERNGIELQGWKTSSTPSDVVTYFSQRFQAVPDHNNPQGYMGLSYNWIPIYAKISLLEKKILYFDMSVSPGIGMTFMQSDVFSTSVTQPAAVNQSPITLSVDVAQQFFLSEHFALRLDLRNHVYKETVYKSNTGDVARDKTTYYGTFMLGITFFQ